MAGPFQGIRVLDLSRLLPGPFCSMLLADLGADVIKVEDPQVGDYIRWWPPKVGSNSGFHVVLNRNKRSLTLNLKKPAGRDLFRRLAASTDVILEGFRPGVMDRLGVGYRELRRINPRLIYCAITGYGQEGPRAQRAGHDINYLALSGVLSYCGRDGDPVLPGVQIGDLGGGALTAAFSIAAALFWRERTGEGQMIDISMTDGAVAWNCLRWGKFLADAKIPEPGDDLLNHGLACYDVYRTRDGRHMSLGALEPQFWKAFCRVMGRPDWDRPDYFLPGPHQKELRDQVAAVFAERTQAQWIQVFRSEDCCCEPVLNLAEVMTDEAMIQRRMVVELHHQAWGAYRQMGLAPKFSQTPGTIRTHAPDLGEHTREVLLEAGLDEETIESLRQEGAV
ncbi:Crotonobetainyl-CoA:carnitine CoA-transferase CaiB [Desulfacinum hydrothermale DSM 13146]|uniref:Crotonobetainyl-CoA:carnitine CoA-transferase CaiB n=1 Tax=Desulfacinum hydrothermale DSM 13146 TaxID=1121390 RepID=A0A1W1XDT3_9BACT|nr:CaiB/BaiF CoA-transferase family protein [Desulfacinum hydrothermale]SMC21661.1 Crotonobetainyl-CoA:carnitine CoA-transferase CaiB [Desulfacinum hydrothermale DSM 13146]